MPHIQLTAEEIEQEVWKPIQGWENYAVSNMGRVKRITPSGSSASHVGKILAHNGGETHLMHQLVQDGKSRGADLARLVAEAFIGPRPKGHFILALDGDRLNCRASNLVYADSYQSNRLGAKDATRIRFLYHEEQWTLLELCEEYDTSRTPIRRVLSRQYWGMVEDGYPSVPAWELRQGGKISGREVYWLRQEYFSTPADQRLGLKSQLAEEYGVGNTTITFILRRQSWKEVPLVDFEAEGMLEDRKYLKKKNR